MRVWSMCVAVCVPGFQPSLSHLIWCGELDIDQVVAGGKPYLHALLNNSSINVLPREAYSGIASLQRRESPEPRPTHA